MGLIYFKRYRMEMDLAGPVLRPRRLPDGYRLVAWEPSLLNAHAQTKYRCFRTEIDANVFPCFSDPNGCLRLMDEISHREGFLKEATWLAEYRPSEQCRPEYCGTIQGVCERSSTGSIQNVGITPEHRGLGLGTCLVLQAIEGFRAADVPRVFLEVTAENVPAIRLYERLGFLRVRTVYKAVEVAYA